MASSIISAAAAVCPLWLVMAPCAVALHLGSGASSGRTTPFGPDEGSDESLRNLEVWAPGRAESDGWMAHELTSDDGSLNWVPQDIGHELALGRESQSRTARNLGGAVESGTGSLLGGLWELGYFTDSQAGLTKHPTKYPKGCDAKMTERAIATPMRDIIHEAPGDDGYCLFAQLGDAFSECAWARRERNFSSQVAHFAAVYEHGAAQSKRKFKEPVAIRYTQNNETILLKTHWRNFPYDDIYCAANGWIDNSLKALVSDYDALTQRSDQECVKLLSIHPELKNMTLAEMIGMTQRDVKGIHASVSSGGGAGVPRAFEMRRHAAAKCLLGKGGLSCDMANCAANFCKLPRAKGSNFEEIGHGVRECGAVPTKARKS